MIVVSKRRGTMKKLFLGIAVLLVFGMMAVSAFAIKDANDVKLTGKHYNLQILGKDKDMDVGDTTNRHTMFVPLSGHCKILMTQAEDDQFKVIDPDGTDGTAVFELAAGHYNVYARALGTPGGKVKIVANALFEDAEQGELLWLGTVELERKTGKPDVVNINKLFYITVTLCTSVDQYGNCDAWVDYKNYWVFDIEELIEYYWDYNNEGLKLLQVRFYPCQLLGVDTNDPNAPNLCVDEDGNPLEASKKTRPAPAKGSTVTATWADIKE
jgi:hypothetical protein